MKPLFLSRTTAKVKYKDLLLNDFVSTEKLDMNYSRMRIHLVNYSKMLIKNHKINSYTFDLLFGLELYTIINQEFGENFELFSNLNFWIYINMNVIPDIVFQRWGPSENRFYKYPKRVWTNQLWWYIHSSWQGDIETTYETIKNNSTDTIGQLVERSGGGYDISLYREIMRQYKDHRKTERLLRDVMLFNSIYYKTTKPLFFEDGIKGYVSMLFDKAINN